MVVNSRSSFCVCGGSRVVKGGGGGGVPGGQRGG